MFSGENHSRGVICPDLYVSFHVKKNESSSISVSVLISVLIL